MSLVLLVFIKIFDDPEIFYFAAMRYFNFNGKILAEEVLITGPNSRAIRYGDGLFETLKYKNGAPILNDDHFSRLWKGMKQLKFEVPKLFTPERLTAEIHFLAQKNKLSECRVRIEIIRGDGGVFDPINNHPNYIIQVWPLALENGKLNDNGLQLCLYKDACKVIDAFSNLKHNNFLPYLMAAFHARENKCNDALLLNSRGNICDSSIANIFMVSENTIYTPALAEGCIAGVMRKFLIASLSGTRYQIIEKELSLTDVAAADELFLSNSIYNIRWVAGFENKTYKKNRVQELDTYLRQTNPTIYC